MAYKTKHKRHCVKYGRGKHGRTCRVYAKGGSGFDGLSRRQRSSSSRGWKKSAPKTREARRQLAANCAASCFLGPGLSFPVCPRCHLNRCSCAPSCSGLSAAYNRAWQTHHQAVAKKALKVARRHGCHWAKGK
jgi:hypothetical protein